MTDFLNNTSLYDINKTCRGCLKSEIILKSLIKGYLGELFTKFTNLEIADNDGLPSKLCTNCTEKLKTCSLFLELCIKSDNILKQQKVIKSENYEEIKSENIQSSDVSVINFLEVQCLPKYENDSSEEANVKDANNSIKIEKVEADFDHLESDENEIENCIIENSFLSSQSKKIRKSVQDVAVSKLERISRRRKSKSTNQGLNSETADCNLYSPCPKFGENILNSDRLEDFGKKPKVDAAICDNEFSAPGPLNDDMTENAVGNFQCSECGEKFKTKSAFQIHKKLHAKDKVFVCHICGKAFGKNCSLKAHTDVTHCELKPHSCSVCLRTYKTANSLRRHAMAHDGLKKYICDICGYGTLIGSNFKRHMASHSDDKPYACKLCPKRYKTQGYLADHNKVHTGERPYKCEFCPMSFRAAKILKYHRRIHTGEKPNICSVCGRGFAQRTALLTHMKIHK